MTDFRFLMSTDATRLTGPVVVRAAANPDQLSGATVSDTTMFRRQRDVSREPTGDHQAHIRAQIGACEREHQSLASQLESLLNAQAVDEIQIRRLKKLKLRIKDRIVGLQMQLVPDIPA